MERKKGHKVVDLKACVSFLEAAVHFLDLLLAEPKERRMQQQSLRSCPKIREKDLNLQVSTVFSVHISMVLPTDRLFGRRTQTESTETVFESVNFCARA